VAELEAAELEVAGVAESEVAELVVAEPCKQPAPPPFQPNVTVLH